VKEGAAGQGRRPDQGAAAVASYWNERIHDLEIARHPIGSLEFFKELDEYRFSKLHYLPRLVDFGAWKGKDVLEVGCGVGIDLARFAAGGAKVVGVDLSPVAIQLAEKNFALRGLPGRLMVAEAARLDFPDASFDLVYAHGVLQYAADPEGIVREMRRLVRPGGQAIFMVYNKLSWLNALSKVSRVDLEHDDAPVFRTYTIGGFRRLLAPFPEVHIVPERFPVASRLHGGIKGMLYNGLFVGAFAVLPRPLVRPLGWHLMGFCRVPVLESADSHSTVSL
jgi:SAM-dependent methyltransferase